MIAYLGPQGTFGEEAANKLAKSVNNPKLMPMPTHDAVAKNIRNGIKADYGLLGYYNQREGVVQENLDLIYENNLFIVDAVRVPIIMSIGKHPDSKIEDKVHSHEKALAQCSEYIASNYPNAMLMPSSSTAEGIHLVKDGKSGLAIGRKEALVKNGLEVIAEDIGNRRHSQQNYTDLLVVSGLPRDNSYYNGNTITMVAITPHYDMPGLLMNILVPFSYEQVNLADIHSRPALDNVRLGNGAAAKMFYLEVEAKANSPELLTCLDMLRRKFKAGDNEIIRVLGSYRKPSL